MMRTGAHESLKTYPVWNASKLADRIGVGIVPGTACGLIPAYAGEITCVRMYAAWNCPHWGKA